MKIDGSLNENAIVNELSLRLKQYRIDSAITREELANKSMVSVGTIARFENGHEIGLSNLVKLITALGLVNNLELLIPDPFDRPSAHIADARPKKRARKKSGTSDWKWGDEL